FIALFDVQGRLQHFVDEVALCGACELNRSNQLGLINELTARCRQSVYAARENRSIAQYASPEEQMLADDILDEDRQDADQLNIERKELEKSTMAAARKAVLESFNSQSEKFCLSLPWLWVKKPYLVSIEFGSVYGTESNVKALTGIEQLATYDDSMKFTHKNSGLYTGNIDAKLPGEDSDLQFKISSLPASVNSVVAPARIILPEVFRMQPKEQLHSAVKVVIGVEVGSGVFHRTVNTIIATGSAATSGAQVLR
ncbi:MAG: hypothetical protein C5B53_05115, partial [Candidatus Melainabacteria bacterium]